MIKKIFVATILILICFSQASGDSLWKKSSSSPYSGQKNFKEGDIIMILILESSSALSKAGTNTDVEDDLALRFDYTLQNLNATTPYQRNEADIRGGNKYGGSGSTTRVSNIQAKVSAVVTKVLDNGNLAISGSHVLEVNREKQTIVITGIIRPSDVSQANTVFSYNVADAKISVQGEGAVAEAESPGWFTRIFNWLF